MKIRFNFLKITIIKKIKSSSFNNHNKQKFKAFFCNKTFNKRKMKTPTNENLQTKFSLVGVFLKGLNISRLI